MPETIREVEFVKSSPDYKGCPSGGLPEYAFVGRSNVGKSSLINFLTGQKKLAKTSNAPGRTRLINHFKVNNSWYLVDLPGYGYAKIAKKDREKFSELIINYLLYRKELTCLFLLIDIRHAPLEIDVEFIRWLGKNRVPFAICFTKTDKLSNPKVESNFATYRSLLLKEWEKLPTVFFTSVPGKKGRDEILKFISDTNIQLHSK